MSPSPVFYTDSFRIDLAEAFHMHYRNLRIELTTEEFRTVAKGFLMGYLEWLSIGRPPHSSTDAFLKFFDAKVDPVIGRGSEMVRGDELSVELQQQTDYIHLHYRGLKIEFSIDEYLEFAEVISEAREQIEVLKTDILKDYPKRVGCYHKVMAKGRVIPNKNGGNFWIGNTYSESSVTKTRDSMIYDQKLGVWQQQFASVQSLQPYQLTRISVLTYAVFRMLRPLVKTVLGISATGGIHFRAWARNCVSVFFGRRGMELARQLVRKARR